MVSPSAAPGTLAGDGWALVAPDGWEEFALFGDDFKVVEIHAPSGTAQIYLGLHRGGLADGTLAQYVRETRIEIEHLFSVIGEGEVTDVVLPTGPAVVFTLTEDFVGRVRTHSTWFLERGDDAWLLDCTNEGSEPIPACAEVARSLRVGD